ncbi:2795_t:CDS:2, partial [Racocetra fulgida]
SDIANYKAMGTKPWESNSTIFSSQITEICHRKFKTIGKNGKPVAFQNDLEWTVLAGIVATALNQSPKDAELYINSYSSNIDSQNCDTVRGDQISDDSNSKVKVFKMKDGFRRGRIDYESFGVLRTKPVGLQSALLSELISPIYLSSITVGDMFYLKDLNRALYERIEGSESTEVLVSGRKQGATKSKKTGLYLSKA